MRKMIRLKLAALAAVAGLLAACGGDADVQMVSPALTASTTVAVQAPASAVASDADALAARLYLLYLGRPGEPDGLAWHANAIRQAGLPADPLALLARYRGDVQARQVLEAFTLSLEAQTVAPSDAEALVNVYWTLFNREPDAGGAAYWGVQLASGGLARAELPLVLLASAHPLDVARFERKEAVARAFTAALDTPARLAAYQGLDAGAALREVLKGVDAGLDAPGQAALVDAALARLGTVPVFSQVQAIVQNRCLGCHSVAPTLPGFATAPRGIRFDSPDQIRADARRIYVNVVETEFMPYGNRTGMTAAERALVRTWFEGGAQ